jgi:ribosomal protein L20A (L18A)
MKFRITGSINLGEEGKRSFDKEIEAKSENHAKHLLFAFFGSNNGLPRAKIRIGTISKV